MSKLCKCDRCGRVVKTYYTIDIEVHDVDENSLLASSEALGFRLIQANKALNREILQFCNNCRNEIEQFMNQKRGVQNDD